MSPQDPRLPQSPAADDDEAVFAAFLDHARLPRRKLGRQGSGPSREHDAVPDGEDIERALASTLHDD